MRPVFSTIKQYLGAIERCHYARRQAATVRLKAHLSSEAERIMGELSGVLDGIGRDKKAFARWARNDRNQGLASRQNALMCVHGMAQENTTFWGAVKRNYTWHREHHA